MVGKCIFNVYNLNMKSSPHVKLSKKLKAIQDPTRLKILTILSKSPLCVCIITEALKLAQPTISRHLSLLEEAGFIAKKRDGRFIIYGLSPEDELTEKLLSLALKETLTDRECIGLFSIVDELKRNKLFPSEEIEFNDKNFKVP